MTVSKLTSEALSGILQKQAAKGVNVESFGYFLEDYIVEGAGLTVDTLDGSRFTVDSLICSLDSVLYGVEGVTMVTRSRGQLFYLDFVPDKGIVLATTHPIDTPYLPLWQLTTGPDGDIDSTEDMRGEMGGIRFKAAFTGIITDQLVVDEDHILNDSISALKLQAGAVTNEKVANGTLTQEKLSNGTLGTLKYANESVTEEKLSPGSVTESRLSSGAVTRSKIGLAAVGTDQLENASVDSFKLQDQSVVHNKLADSSVTEDKLNNASVSDKKLKDGSVTWRKLAANLIINGDSSVEAAQARTNTLTNETYNSLQHRMDAEYDELLLRTADIYGGSFLDEESEYAISGGAF